MFSAGHDAQTSVALFSSSFDLGGGVGRQFRLDGGDFLPNGLGGAVSVGRARRASLRRVLLQVPGLVRLHEGLPALGFDKVHAEFGRRHGGHLLVGLSDALGEGGDAALLEILVHEGVHDWIVEAVEEADGLDHGDDHVDGDAVVFVLQIIWRRREATVRNTEALNRLLTGGSCRLLTVLKQHVDGVERCPADGEQQNDGDHHLNGSLLFPVGKKKNQTTFGG